MTYREMYRCKLCGQTFDGCERETDNELTAENVSTFMGTQPNYFHCCYGGDVGKSEFLGWRKVDE